VRLERVTDPALVAAEIATALAQRDGTDGPTADGLVGYLGERELLLVIDNFEHLLDAAALIAELLALASPNRVLVSSRTPLRIRGEQTFEVEPLELPADESDLEVAQSPESSRTAVHPVRAGGQSRTADRRADDADHRPRLPGAGRAAARDRAGGVALALARPVQIADQLAQPLLIGEHALCDLPDRQQTLEATIRWSYDLLSDAGRHALRSAAVFLGGLTLPALEADHRRAGAGRDRRAARGRPGPPPGRQRPPRAPRARACLRARRTVGRRTRGRGTRPAPAVLCRPRRARD
jgi:predicted ATPase